MDDHVRGRPFQKGQSGNREGRPTVGASVAEHIRQLGGDDGHAYVEQLHRLAVGPHNDTRARLTAIGLLLDRGYGRPPQDMEPPCGVAAGPLQNLLLLSHDELFVLRALVAKISSEPVPELSAVGEAVAELARQL